MKNLTINGKYYTQVFGSTLPGPIWKQSMTAALQGSEPATFTLSNEWSLRPARGVTSIAPLPVESGLGGGPEGFVFDNSAKPAPIATQTAPTTEPTDDGTVPAVPDEAPVTTP